MKKLMIILFVSVFFASAGTVLTIGDHEFSLQDFYSHQPKKQWEHADSLQKDQIFMEFVKRKLCVLEANKMGFQNDPVVAVKIQNRSRQILVNESYERFVAQPLVPSLDLELARRYAKNELFASHILIAYSGSQFANNAPRRTLDEAFVLAQQIKKEYDAGDAFDVLAQKYSDDQSVEKNSGVLGWLEWGATVPAFQLAAFSLEVGAVSSPVLTVFGYHLILITDKRPSDFQYLNDDAYDSYILNITKKSIRNQLRPAALKYDSLKIESYGVYFNMDAIQSIIGAYDRLEKETSLGVANPVNSVSLLESLDRLGVLCVYGGGGYGPRWFARHLSRLPSSRWPVFKSKEGVIAVFKIIILQDIAAKEGAVAGVELSFTYKQKQEQMISGLLYDAYLKHLVNSVPAPDTSDVINYYNANKADDYMEQEKVVVREIRVEERGAADSLLLLLDAGEDFSSLARQNSLINPGEGGIYGPFSRSQNRSFFDAAMLLGGDKISPVIPSSGNNFSILKLVERVSKSPLSIEHVYTQIESILIKKSQNSAKVDEIDALLKVYSINKNMSLLN